MHLTIGAFGNTDFVKKLAKAGTINDIAVYNHASSEGVLTYVSPASDKVQPLLQAIGMADFPVLWISEVTKEIGEQIVAVDAAGFSHGIIVADGVPEEQIKQVIKGSSLESFAILSNDTALLRQKILQAPVSKNSQNPWVPVDNYFTVKSIGTVVLGIVRQGKIKKYDTLRIEPLGREIMIKGIQSQDKDFHETEAGMRVGLNIKGADAEELKRGCVICKESKVSKDVAASFSKSRYSKEQPEKNNQLFIAAGLQVIAATIADIQPGRLTLKLEQPLAYQPNQRVIFASTKQALPRIIGSGIIE